MLIFNNNGICKPAPLLNSSVARRCFTRPTTSSCGEVTSGSEFEKTIEKSSYTGHATRLQCKGSLLPGLPSKKTFCSPEEGVGLALDSPPKLRSFPVRLISAVPPWLSKHEEKSSINKYSTIILTNNTNNNRQQQQLTQN